jgi:hypothetical protein
MLTRKTRKTVPRRSFSYGITGTSSHGAGRKRIVVSENKNPEEGALSGLFVFSSPPRVSIGRKTLPVQRSLVIAKELWDRDVETR